MKILQISPEGNYGSIGTIAEEIGKVLIESGHLSHIAIGNYDLPSESHIYKIGSEIDRYLHGVETRIFDRHGLGSKTATRNLIVKIKQLAPDLINIHQLHGYYLNYQILFEYLLESKTPTVLSFQDCWAFTGHCAWFDDIGCDKWQTHCHHCPAKNDYPASFFVDNSFGNFDLKKRVFNSLPNAHLVTVSKWMADKISKSFLQSLPLTVIYNGINLHTFSHIKETDDFPFPSNLKNKFIILGVASPWSPRKGLTDFIQLAKLLKDDEAIVLVGLSSDQIKKLPANILGFEKVMNQTELAKFYRNADLYFNPSVEESFGLTTVEAMACGTPALVYAATACPELIAEGTGFVVEKHDLAKVRDLITRIKTDPDQVISHEKCVGWVKQNFDAGERYRDYVRLYEQIIKDNTNEK